MNLPDGITTDEVWAKRGDNHIVVTLHADTTRWDAAMERLRADVRTWQRVMRRIVMQVRRAYRGHQTSGHRHEGTRDWALRYAPARKDVPLGERTLAKRR